MAGIYDILRHRNTQCPVAIALYGDWGSGKTSAMRWLESRLDEWNDQEDTDRGENRPHPGNLPHPRVYPVWFDPWKYHTKEDVWRGIIAEVILAMLRVRSLRGHDKVQAIKFALRRFGAFLGRSFLTALSHISFKASAEAGIPGADGKDIAKASAEFEFTKEMSEDLYREWKDYRHPEKGFLNDFESALQTFIDLCLPRTEIPSELRGAKPRIHYHERIVLFIDDLDRCLPAVTLEVLEALKLYLNIPALIFVVGLDQNVVQSVVEKHYTEAGVSGVKARDYLAKLFQVELPVAPTGEQMKGYLSLQLRELDTATGNYWSKTLPDEYETIIADALATLTKSNPREIKRQLNSSLLFARSLAEDPELLTGDNALPKEQIFASGLAYYLIRRLIQQKYPPLAGRFEVDRTEHEWLEKASLIRQAQNWSAGRMKQIIEWASLDLADYNNAIVEWNQMHRNAYQDARKIDLGPGGVRMLTAENSQTDKAKEISRIASIEPPRDQSWEADWKNIYQRRPADDKGPIDSPFFTDPLLWELLRVPFHTHIAQRAPAAPSSRTAPPPFDITSLPPKMQQALLAATSQTADAFDPAKLATIEELALNDCGVTDVHLTHLTRCTSLSSLELRSNPLTAVENLPGNLRKLYLRRCTGITEVNHLPATLQRLSLRFCTGITCVDDLPETLLDLSLDGCTGIKAVDRLPKNLQALSLRECIGLTTLESLPGNLQTLYLSYCTGLTTLERLPEALEHLNVERCKNLTRLGPLPEGLRHVDIANCPKLDEETRGRLREWVQGGKKGERQLYE